MISSTPAPPYYAVIFTSIHSDQDAGYAKMNDLLSGILRDQPGYLGMESVSGEIGITVSYWQNLDSILAWKNQKDHQLAQNKGKQQWYDQYKVRICKVERDYSFEGVNHTRTTKNNPSF